MHPTVIKLRYDSEWSGRMKLYLLVINYYIFDDPMSIVDQKCVYRVPLV